MAGVLAALLLGSTCLVSANHSDPWSVDSSVVSTLTEVDLGDDNRQTLFEKGITFDAFLAGAEKRKVQWHANYETATVDEQLLARVGALSRQWRLLVVAVDWCSDSVGTIPYLARFAEGLDNVDLRIIDATVGRGVMLAHRTPDGRAATPTVVLLNDQYEEVGCFIERPAVLQQWALLNKEVLDEDEFAKRKLDWFDQDGGQQTIEAVVELLEAAAAGNTGC